MKNQAQDIEHSIITKYRKNLWRPFTKAVKDYELIQDGDKIAVCISGGKDSMLMAKLLEELQKHGPVNFSLVYLVMNPGYSKTTENQIIKNAKLMNININMFNSDIFKVLETEVAEAKSPCYLCARMRRGCLYSKAQELGCNKIALGHHFDDVIETIMLSIMYAGEYRSMLPKLKSTNFKDMELIRPMYLIREKDIINFAQYHHLEFINCACKFTSDVNAQKKDSKRLAVKKLLNELRKKDSNIDYNIFSSSENVEIETVIGYKKNGQKISFLKDYNK
jgi:tRNA 2-thiocytidine biosynthesis protein TtcA